MCCLVIVFLYKVKFHWNVRLLRVSGILLLGSWIATCMAIFYLLKYSNLDILITRCLELSNKVRGLVLWEWLHGAMNMPEICRQFWNKQVKFRYSMYAKKDVHQFLFGLHLMLLEESFFFNSSRWCDACFWPLEETSVKIEWKQKYFHKWNAFENVIWKMAAPISPFIC